MVNGAIRGPVYKYQSPRTKTISGAVFRNEERGYTAKIEKSYRERSSGLYRQTTYFFPNELEIVAETARELQRYIEQNPLPNSEKAQKQQQNQYVDDGEFPY